MKDTRTYVVWLSEHSTPERWAFVPKRAGTHTFECQEARVWKTARGVQKWIDAHRTTGAHYATPVPLNGVILNELVREYVLANGGGKGRWRDYSIPTRLGVLEISVHDDWIACVFDDTERAKQRFGHWKWNWGCGEREDPHVLFEQWKRAVDKLLIPREAAAL